MMMTTTTTSSFLITGVFLLLTLPCRPCQQTWGCQELIATAMKEYKDCIDYTYRMLFEVQYPLASGTKIKETCQSIAYIQCQEAAERKLGSCLDYLQRETLQNVFELVSRGLRYWCMDYGRNLLEFYNQRGPNCYYQRQSFLRNCEAENPLVNPRLVAFDYNYCRIQSDVINCMQQVYEQCLAYENPELIRGYFNALWTGTPCNTMTSALELHSGAPTSVASKVLLTSIAMLTSWWWFRTVL